MQNNIEQFRDIVKNNFKKKEFTYHEWMVEYHLEIVERIALELCDKYPEADRDLVQTLVWFHDFGKPLDEQNEQAVTRERGPETMLACGFPDDFVKTVLEYWELMERKSEIDIRTTPIEVQIISSADGASHLVGVFYPSYFGDGNSFAITQQRLSEKIEKDWGRKIVLPEAREAFKERYLRAKEMLGEFPPYFLI